MGAGQGAGAVIGAMNEHCPQELAAGIGLTVTKADFCRLYQGILTGYPDRSLEWILLRHDKRGDEFLGAGDLTRLIGVFLIESLSRVRVDQDSRGCPDRRCTVRPE